MPGRYAFVPARSRSSTHGSGTVGAATDPRLCPEVQLALDVNVDPGPDQGQTILTDETVNVWVCLEPDSGQIQARVEGILGK